LADIFASVRLALDQTTLEADAAAAGTQAGASAGDAMNTELNAKLAASSGVKDALALEATGAAGTKGSLATDAAGLGLVSTGAKDATAASKDASVAVKDATSVVKDLGKNASNAASGLVSMVSSLTGLPPQAALAGAALAITVGVLYEAGQTSDAVNQQVSQLTIAMQDHGESYVDLAPKVDAAIKSGEQYGYTADDTRASILKMTEAGITMGEAQDALGPIMDLARAKNISLSDATEIYTKAMMGSAKGLKDLGIILPSVSAAAADVEKATAKVTTAQDNLTKAQDAGKKAGENLSVAQQELAIVQDSLKGKTTLTAAESLKLQQAQDKVTTAQEALTQAATKTTDAQDKLKAAQDALTLAQNGGVDKAARLAQINADLTKAVGDQRASVTPMEVAQAKMNDTWERFAVTVGPWAQKEFVWIETAVANLASSAMDLIDWLSNLWGSISKLNGPLGTVRDVILNFCTGGLVLFWGHLSDIANIIQTVITWLGNLVGAAQNDAKQIANALKPVTDALGAVSGAVSNAGGVFSSLTSWVPHFASGGPYQPGLRIVGENGPELDVSGTPGTIIPNGQLASALGGGQQPIVINIGSYTGTVDQLAAKLAHHIRLASAT